MVVTRLSDDPCMTLIETITGPRGLLESMSTSDTPGKRIQPRWTGDHATDPRRRGAGAGVFLL